MKDRESRYRTLVWRAVAAAALLLVGVSRGAAAQGASADTTLRLELFGFAQGDICRRQLKQNRLFFWKLLQRLFGSLKVVRRKRYFRQEQQGFSVVRRLLQNKKDLLFRLGEITHRLVDSSQP